MRKVTLPKSVGEATKSVKANWSHFRVNYIVVMVATMAITMLVRSFYRYAPPWWSFALPLPRTVV